MRPKKVVKYTYEILSSLLFNFHRLLMVIYVFHCYICVMPICLCNTSAIQTHIVLLRQSYGRFRTEIIEKVRKCQYLAKNVLITNVCN